MAIPVIMPKQGQSVETCIITRWFKKKGDTVAPGDILFSYETDKAAFDMESPGEGTLLALYFEEGAEVPVLQNVAVIGQPGEDVDSFNPSGITADLKDTENHAVIENAGNTRTGADESYRIKESEEVVAGPGNRIRISPRARKLAERKKIDITILHGSGPNGRITAIDVEKAVPASETKTAEKSPLTGEFTEKPLSNVRKLISKAMHSSLQNSAQLTHHMSADVRNLLEARQKIKNDISAGKNIQDITLNDMICWCVIKALKKFPEANSHFLEDRIKTFNKVHLGLAVDTQRGLMVPAVKNADYMDLQGLSRALKEAAESCRKGNIDPELLHSSSATFTVSNLGNYGVEMFTPVINLPQVAILGVCAIINRPASLGNNIFGFVPYIGLSLTYDHRAIDGGPATLFLKEIREQIESFRFIM
jgi:pyruvate dehydrogenase E2 component (dihydrolipoamide acetyltransferase)